MHVVPAGDGMGNYYTVTRHGLLFAFADTLPTNVEVSYLYLYMYPGCWCAIM